MPPPYAIQKKQRIRRFSLTYKHIFSFEYLYKRLHEWLLDEGYCNASNDKWIETLYTHRVFSNGAKQIWVRWRTNKDYNNEFIKFYLNIDFHGLNLTGAEIVHEGTKVKMDKGEVEVFITAQMEVDPSGSWNKNFILKNSYLQNFYLNRIYKHQLEKAEEDLIKDTARLLGAIKQYFQLESFIPEYEEEPFHEPKGR